MSSSSEDEEEIIAWFLRRRQQRIRRKYWCHPYIEKNVRYRLFVAAAQLNETDSKFIACYRMSKASYVELVKMVAPFMHKVDTNMREWVTAEERILITVRYLATGCSFVALSLYFARGESTIGIIVKDTTRIIWNVLQETSMPVPIGHQWKLIAHRFETLWNVPNCLGALDGKHIRIEKFPNTGSENFNYKHFHSIILLACCDADGAFTMIEPGCAGRNSDGGVYKVSAIKYWINHGGFQIPSPTPLRYDEIQSPFPYYFLADKAFPLARNVMKPYNGKKLNNVRRIFNYRLNRGRKTVECTFGMAAEKFAVLNGPIRCRNVEKVTDIVKAACILHNYVRKRERIDYTPATVEIAEGPCPRQHPITESSSAVTVRQYLASYFISPRSSLPWQWEKR